MLHLTWLESDSAGRVSVLSPPPNITGKFHLGHFMEFNLIGLLNHTLKRVGNQVSIIGGWDHAGQSMEKHFRHLPGQRRVETLLERTREGIGAFEEQLARWRLGLGLDVARFSLDDGFQLMTRLALENMRSKGLVGISNRFVNVNLSNWEPVQEIEIQRKMVKKELFTLVYRSVDGTASLEVATTRPLTVLGDVALCCHPDDDRYASLVGKDFLVPYGGQAVRLHASAAVDASFGSGLLKVTPQYDKRDLRVAEELSLAVGTDDPVGRLVVSRGCDYHTLEREAVSTMERVGLCSGRQWTRGQKEFLASDDSSEVMPLLCERPVIKLAELARKHGEEVLLRTVIKPQWVRNEVRYWMENLDDWDFTRDGCWGVDLGGGKVADTWFNASLWPLLAPGRVDYLICGWDIMFFWFIKMSLVSAALLGRVPFRRVYLHPLVVDGQGRKMSKSFGNTVEPDELLTRYGTDACRLAILEGMKDNKYTTVVPSTRNRKLLNKLRNFVPFFEKNIECAVHRKIPTQRMRILAARHWWSQIAMKRAFYSGVLRLDQQTAFDSLYCYVSDFSRSLTKFRGTDLVGELGLVCVSLMATIAYVAVDTRREYAQRLRSATAGVNSVLRTVGHAPVHISTQRYEEIQEFLLITGKIPNGNGGDKGKIPII